MFGMQYFCCVPRLGLSWPLLGIAGLVPQEQILCCHMMNIQLNKLRFGQRQLNIDPDLSPFFSLFFFCLHGPLLHFCPEKPKKQLGHFPAFLTSPLDQYLRRLGFGFRHDYIFKFKMPKLRLTVKNSWLKINR